MDWQALGIEPTKDKKAITAAYRARLRQTNPEEKPEEFKALRAAYEEALRLADQEEAAPARDESPVGLWMERVAALYADFPARIRAENWEALTRDDVCMGLDTRPLAEEALLRFLFDDFFLPQAVWQVLDATFVFSTRAEELYESWPQEFIDNAVLDGIRLPASLPYELFEPGVHAADCDAYRRLYYQAGQTPPAQLGEILDRMEALLESHPYGRALRCGWQINNGHRQSGAAGFEKLAKAYPNDPVLNLDWAQVCLEEGKPEEAEAVVRRLLSEDPNHIGVNRTLAECLAARGEYDEAKELTYELIHASGHDPRLADELHGRMKEWNRELIARREAALDRDPGDSENAIELAWCYIQNERPGDAMEVARRIDPECPDPFAYHNLMGKLCCNLQMFDEGAAHLEKVITILRNMKPDGTVETEKRIRRIPEMLQIQGNCLLQMGQKEGALERFEQALALAPEDPEVLNIMSRVYLDSGDYEGCVEILERLLRITPDSWFARLYLSLALYKLHRDGEAFESINRSIALHGGNLIAYHLKMQILLRNGVFEQVHAVLDFLKEFGAPEDVSTDWIEAQLMELEEKNEKKAFEQYQAIARRLEAGEEMLFGAQLYFRMAVLMAQQMDEEREEDRRILLDVLEKGLAHDKFDGDCLEYKARLLVQSDKLPEAIEMYQSLGRPSEWELANLYFEDLPRYAQEALACYEALLEKRQIPEFCFYAATCKRYLGDYDSARRYLERVLELDSADLNGYHGLACTYLALGRNEVALHHAARAVAVMEETGGAYNWLLDHRIQVLRRMGRHQEALAAVDEAMSRYDYPQGFDTKFRVCCQFGLWDQAEQVLEQWRQAWRDDPEQAAAAGLYNLLRGKMFRAAMVMGKAKRHLPPDRVFDFRVQLADLECNHKRRVQLLGAFAARHPDSDYAQMNLALAHWWNGNREAAQQAAERALVLLDDILKQHRIDEALFRTRRCAVLAVLGRVEEARAELTAARQLPLCDYCTCGSCKDADIYEAYIEEIAGNYEKAKALYAAGRKNWPDELDFISGEARMKKKGKGRC